MNSNFTSIDYIIFGLYALVILSVGLWVSRGKKGVKKTAQDYFLASKSLPWWAVGASLIAANISAEQMIGMSGSGMAIGLSIATYEWMAALTLIIVGKYFLPIFIEKGLYTIPEFIEKRFSTNLKTILAVFWIALFIFVNLTSVLFLGGKAIDTIIGQGDGSMIFPAIIALALFAAAYSLYGGLAAVAWTDVIQVALLVIGGMITTVIALDHVTPDGGIFNGISHVYETAGDKFHMILKKRESGVHEPARHRRSDRRHVDRQPVLLGLQPVYHPAHPCSQKPEGSAEGNRICRIPETDNSPFRCDPGHHRLRDVLRTGRNRTH